MPRTEPRTPHLAPGAFALLAAALLVACSCGPTPAPRPPAPTVVAIDCLVTSQAGGPVSGATCTLSDVGPIVTNADGYALWPAVTVGTRTLVVTAPSYLPYGPAPYTLDAGTRHLPVSLAPRPPPHPSAGEHGALHPCPLAICQDDNLPWVGRGADSFRLLERLIAGEDIQPVVDELVTVGATYVRVFGMYDGGIGVLHPSGDAYFGAIAVLADRLAAQGLRMEFVVFADAQRVLPDVSAQRAHWDRVRAVVAGRWNVWLELANEYPANGVDPAQFSDPGGVASRGSALGDAAPFVPPWTLVTDHPGRGPEWPRKTSCRDITAQLHVACLEDEPEGASEQANGSRDTDPAHFAEAGFLYALHAAGGLFHSDSGIDARPLGPTERACAVALFEAMRHVPRVAQLWPYQRGAMGGGAGIGNMPIEHRDLDEGAFGALRTFCKGNGAEAWCVAVMPGPAWTAQPRDGWRIADTWGSRGELLHLVKP